MLWINCALIELVVVPNTCRCAVQPSAILTQIHKHAENVIRDFEVTAQVTYHKIFIEIQNVYNLSTSVGRPDSQQPNGMGFSK